MESAPEEVEAVGEVEGEGVRVLAPCELAAGGRERGKEAETEAVDTMSEGKTCDPDFILLLVLPLNNTCRLIVNFDGTELDSPPTPSAENSKGFSIYYSQISC